MLRYGPLSRRLVQLSLPILVENFLVMTLGTVDTLMLSSLSDNSVAAVGMVNQLVNLVFIVFQVISLGTTILCSQYFGARLHDKVVQVVGVSLVFNFLCGLFFSLVLFVFAPQILGLMGLRAELMAEGCQYMRLVGAFAFLQAMSLAISASLRSAGLTRYPMIVAGVVNVLNIVGDWALIFGHLGMPAMGVRGAALSSVICRGISVVLLFIFLFRKQISSFPKRLFSPFPWSDMGRVLKIGVPSAGEQMSYSLSQVVITYFINMMGNEQLAVRSYVTNIVIFTFMTALSMSQGGSIEIGHLIGEHRFNAAYRLGRRVGHLSMMITMAIAIGTALAGPLIFGFLSDNGEIVRLGCAVLWADVLVEYGRAINFFGVNCLRAAGDIYFPVLTGIAICWTVSVGFSYLFGIALGGGLVALWIALGMDELTRGCIFLYRWKSRKWASKAFV